MQQTSAKMPSYLLFSLRSERPVKLVDEYDFVKPDGMDYFPVLRVDAPNPAH